ncbi:hypothetical protein TGMAS_313418 [Toxoplasma gondii MAS]|uniref:Uncharacterized protein n=1 Tax=Toxoplasma gondii MAS TaxID=943118 RepID=A0A086QYV8_TOXGO|nr:hypothetical protein TGMAS_313418 [Toxoplasma gondii MAS]
MRKVDMGTKRKVEKEERKVEKPSLVVSTHLVRGTGEVLKSGLWKTGNSSGMGPACFSQKPKRQAPLCKRRGEDKCTPEKSHFIHMSRPTCLLEFVFFFIPKLGKHTAKSG